MNDTTKPAAQAVASSHKVPSKYEVDTLGDELANLEMKLSKIRRKAILSAGEARRDQIELEEIEKSTATKAAEFREMVDRFTLPPKTVEIPAALAAVRERMAEVAKQEPEAAKAIEAISAALDQPGEGGKVSLGKAYLVGENGAEMIVPANSPLGKAVAAGMSYHGETASVTVTGKVGDDKVMRDLAIDAPSGSFRERLAPQNMATHVAGVVVDRIENAKPGEGTPVPAIDDPEVLAPKYDDGRKIPDAIDDPKAVEERSAELIKEDIWGKAHRGYLPPEGSPPICELWIFQRIKGEVVRHLTWDRAESLWTEFDRKRGQWLPVYSSDLEPDIWKRGDLKHAMDANKPKRNLFSAKA